MVLPSARHGTEHLQKYHSRSIKSTLGDIFPQDVPCIRSCHSVWCQAVLCVQQRGTLRAPVSMHGSDLPIDLPHSWMMGEHLQEILVVRKYQIVHLQVGRIGVRHELWFK